MLTDPETQASTEVEFYASGWGTSPWAIKNPSRLELDLDKAEYQPATRRRCRCGRRSPGKLLLTVERDRVLDTQVYELTGNTATIQVPIQRGVPAQRLRHGHAGAAGGRPRGGLGRPGVRGRAAAGEPDGQSAEPPRSRRRTEMRPETGTSRWPSRRCRTRW